MNPAPAFRRFSEAHLVVILLTIIVPLGLGFAVRISKSQRFERSVAGCLAALLVVNYIGYAAYLSRAGTLRWQQVLPFQLCDWAMIAVIVALISGRRGWFEVAYFWGIGGTVQAILTPDLKYAFPDVRFLTFFIGHCGIVAGILFLMLTRRFRPTAASIGRTFAWSELYLVLTLLVNYITGENYGFLTHKPQEFSLLSYLSDSRPLYILQMHGLALIFFSALYAPFALVDLLRRNTLSPIAQENRS
jgi:hypothetical integral membrane protein (TIGR02206 family)